MLSLLFVAVLLLLGGSGRAECPNACNGKGVCSGRDVCTCYRGWMGNDCTRRVCPFNVAHVDIPKGDLDSSGTVTGPSQLVVRNSQVFPHGTTELFPSMLDSDQNVMQNSAHDYAECSNKGVCDRSKGVCTCMTGYEGNACQYASCPGYKCSGHGQCLSARDLAARDAENTYELWDADKTLGCLCDAGFTGPDCSLSKCKVGYDPLYRDPGNSRRFANWSYVVYHMAGDSRVPIRGNYSLIFYDESGEDWRTDPIPYGATCSRVIRALENLPNNAIPDGSVRCTQWTDYNLITNADEPMLGGSCLQFSGCQGRLAPAISQYRGVKYTLAFPRNPGVLKPIQVDWFLDGYRPTLSTTEYLSTLGSFVYANGFSGEYTEFFTQKCVGVDVNLATIPDSPTTSAATVLAGLTPLEFRYLAVCLGASDNLPDFSATVTVGGSSYTWDYGSTTWPHIVRLVDQSANPTTDLCDELNAVENPTPGADYSLNGGRSGTSKGRSCTVSAPSGFYAVLYYDPMAQIFKLLNRPGEDYSPTTVFSVFTTTGLAHLVSGSAKVYTHKRKPYSTTVYTTNSTTAFPNYRGNIDCLSNQPNQNGALECLEKGDRVFFLDPVLPANNPKYVNLHTVKRVYTANQNLNARSSTPGNVRITLDTAMTSHWPINDLTVTGRVYKFFPPGAWDPPTSSYQYVAECSNRGLCHRDSGQCTCFSSFTGDDCSVENNFAK